MPTPLPLNLRRLTALLVLAAFAGLATLLLAGANDNSAAATPPSKYRVKFPKHRTLITAVGVELQYANVIAQIGGEYVSVGSIMSDPNTDPHTFEASPGVAETVHAAKLIVQNGAGYDSFMNKIESASSGGSRKIIDMQTLLGLPASTENPHLWYEPTAMPKLAAALATDLSALDPAHSHYFKANAATFDASLKPWVKGLALFKHNHPKLPVATSEPVGDYMLTAAGTNDLTPWNLQADVMNGVDPAPQDVTLQENLFKDHKVKVFLYNAQVTDTLTQTFLSLATRYHIPVVALYETMPFGYSYQTWMQAELKALSLAVDKHKSTTKL